MKTTEELQNELLELEIIEKKKNIQLIENEDKRLQDIINHKKKTNIFFCIFIPLVMLFLFATAFLHHS
jgi:hypothetical protein